MEHINLKDHQTAIVNGFFDIQMAASPHINRSLHRGLILSNFAKTSLGYIKTFDLLILKAQEKPCIRIYINKIVEHYLERIEKPMRIFLKSVSKKNLEAYEELIDLKLIAFVG